MIKLLDKKTREEEFIKRKNLINHFYWQESKNSVQGIEDDLVEYPQFLDYLKSTVQKKDFVKKHLENTKKTKFLLEQNEENLRLLREEGNELKIRILENLGKISEINIEITPYIEQHHINMAKAINKVYLKYNKEIKKSTIIKNQNYLDKASRIAIPKKENNLKLTNVIWQAEINIFNLMMETEIYKIKGITLDDAILNIKEGPQNKMINAYKTATFNYKMNEIDRIYSK